MPCHYLCLFWDFHPARNAVVTGVERHFPGSRAGASCYPIRALRTSQYLYLKNYEPERMPSGDPAYKEILEELSARLDEDLKTTSDPRATGKGEIFEQYAREYPGHIRDQAKQD